MTSRAALLMCAMCSTAGLACASQPVGFQTHYIGLGTGDTSVAIAADALGDIFVVSRTLGSANTPAIHVTKTDPLGNVVAVMDFGRGVSPAAAAVDAQGNLVVAGGGLITKLDNALANTLATASLPATAQAVAIDASGNVYVAGSAAGDFPTTPGAYESNQPTGATYAFIAEFSPDLSQILNATLFGSVTADCNQTSNLCRMSNGPGLYARTIATSIALDPSGAVLIAGHTTGVPAPLSVAPYNYGFVAKFSADFTSLSSQTVFNPVGDPSGETYIRAMALDPQGNVLLVGDTGKIGPFTGASLQPNPPAYGTPGFVMKLDSTLALLWGTYCGGGYPGQAVDGVAVDAQANIWITGVSMGSQLPNSTSTSIAYLPFIAELTPDGSSVSNLVWSQFGGAGIAAIPNGGIAVLGATDSFLLQSPPDQPSLLMVASSANNQSTGTIAPAELISLYGTGIGPASPLGGVVTDGAFTNNLGGYQVLFNGVAAPLLYAGPNQFNVVSPVALAGTQTAAIQVVGPAGTTVFPTVFVAAARPQIFSQPIPFVPPFEVNPAPELITYAIGTNEDGTVNANANPAPRGSIVTIWATGTGLTGSTLPDGAIGTSAAASNLPIVMPWGSESPMEILYSGQAPGAVQGLTQINFRVPADATGGVPINFQLAGATSGPAVVQFFRPN